MECVPCIGVRERQLFCSAIVQKMAETEMDYMIKQLVESETKVSSTATLSLSLSPNYSYYPHCRIIVSWISWETCVCVKSVQFPPLRVSYMHSL